MSTLQWRYTTPGTAPVPDCDSCMRLASEPSFVDGLVWAAGELGRDGGSITVGELIRMSVERHHADNHLLPPR